MTTFFKQLFNHDDYPIHIVAGNYQEFQNFVIRKRQKGFNFNYAYVNDVDSIRGLNKIRGLYVGSYKTRPDLSQIQEFIHIIKSKSNYVDIA